MSECITRVTKILKVEHHPNADKLDVAQVDGWHCIVGRDTYKAGDKCIYIPIDSIIPYPLEKIIFAGAKVKLSKGRIKTIKLRGLISQGLVVHPDTIKEYNKSIILERLSL